MEQSGEVIGGTEWGGEWRTEWGGEWRNGVGG